MEGKRAPGHVLVIALLGIILSIAALVAIFMSQASGWPLEYGAVLFVVGLITTIVGSVLARKYKPGTK